MPLMMFYERGVIEAKIVLCYHNYKEQLITGMVLWISLRK